MILSFTSFKCNTVNKSFEIDDCCITVCYWSVCYSYSSGILLLLFLKCCFYFFVCYSCVNLSYLNTFVFSKCHFWSYSHFCCEDERFSFFDLCYIDLRLRYDLLLTLAQCFAVCIRDQLVCCIFIENTCTIHFLDHSSWNFTFTETRDADFVLLFHVSSL